jgi:alpha-1,6-mannosyltransferase
VNAPAQPLTVVTNWGAHGAEPLGLLLLAIALAGIAYRHLLCRRDPLPMSRILIVCLAALALAWCVPVLFSSDIYAYAAYGQLAWMGRNPYAHTPSSSNALLLDAAWQWGGTFPICVYGPAFVAISRVTVTTFARFGPLAQLDALRALATLALLACAPLTYAAFSGDRTVKLRAAATIALNPVAIWCAAEGHNDAIALAIVLAGFAVARSGSYGIGATIVAFSALVKSPGIAAAFAFAIADRRARAGAVIGVALALVLSVPLIAGIASSLAPHSRYAAFASLQGIVDPIAGPVAAIAFAILVAVLLMWSAIARLRAGRSEGWTRLGIAAWVLIPNPYPWYGLWLVALAALAPRTRAGLAAILLSFSALLRYVPDAVASPKGADAVVLSIVAALPLLLLLRYNERFV